MTLDVSAYPLCAARLRFQFTNLSEQGMNAYWAAVAIADCFRDAELAEHGGINFGLRTEENGRFILAAMEKLLMKRQQRTVANATFADAGLRSMLGARGVKTSMLTREDDYWTAAETLFPGHIKRNGGAGVLYYQINKIPKKTRKRLATENLCKLPAEWLSDASVHARKLH